MSELQRFLDDMIVALTRFAGAVDRTVSQLLSGLLRFLDAAYNWLAKIAERIANYLARFFPALANVLFALVKLALFYIPALLCFAWYALGGGKGWVIIGMAWAVFITLIGLTYGKRPRPQTTDVRRRY